MSQNFLERCNEKMQSLYDCCGKKVNELYAKLAEDVQSLYNHCKAQASELVAKLLEKVQLLYNDCLEKIAAVIAQVKAVIAVAAAGDCRTYETTLSCAAQYLAPQSAFYLLVYSGRRSEYR